MANPSRVGAPLHAYAIIPHMKNSQWPDPISPSKPEHIQTLLHGFWETLAHLPDLLARGEHLLAEHCTADLRLIILEMVLALNGISRPTTTRHLNTYLSASQKAALEKTLLAPVVNGASWVGRSVALVVIYRWYAPQLVSRYELVYPIAQEEQTWRLLQQIPEWPKTVTTEDQPGAIR